MNAGAQQSNIGPRSDHVDLAVEIFRMLADPTRILLLWAMRNGEMAVNDLAEYAGKPATGVSQHLAKLRMARIVQSRRQGNQIFYRIGNSHVRQLVEDAIFQAEHTADGIPDHHRAESMLAPIPTPTSDRGVSAARRHDREDALGDDRPA